MSQLIDKLKDSSRLTPSPIGFGRMGSGSNKSRMVLVAREDSPSPEGLDERAKGAGAVLFTASAGTQKSVLGSLSKASPGIPWGGRVTDGSAQGVEKLVKAGGDFVFFKPEKTPLGLMRYDKLGKVLELDASLPDNLLRVVNGIPVDSVFLSFNWEDEPYLSWQHLMFFQHFADTLTKPLIVGVPESIGGKDLVILWEAGVVGVVVPTAVVRTLGEEIKELDFPPRRKTWRREAVLPHLGSEAPVKPEEEEEDE